jgi:hypothetical protein
MLNFFAFTPKLCTYPHLVKASQPHHISQVSQYLDFQPGQPSYWTKFRDMEENTYILGIIRRSCRKEKEILLSPCIR